MEVHHHAHHSGKKKWKPYIWEFLMLFLAVFCGFLAEYQLEHKIERDRELQYVESMISDMKEDTVKINNTVAFCTTQVAAFDSLLQNIYNTPYTDSTIKMLYYLERRYSSTKNIVALTKRTITQLQNSGALRLIRNKAASDSIIVYNEATELAQTQGQYFTNVRLGRVDALSIQLFDSKYLLNYNRNTVAEILKIKTPVLLLNNDQRLLKEFANSIYQAKGTLGNYIAMLQEVKSKATSMIGFLENKYDLK